MREMPKFSADVPRASELSVPLYEIVKRQITEAIMMGKWPAGTVLPSEIALSQMFGVAVGTIRRALQDLTNEGLLSRRRKTGTVVTGRTPQHSLRFFFQYFRLHGLDGSLQNSTSDILSLKRREANDEERSGLRLDDASEVISIHRLRSVGGHPVMHEVMALPARMLPEFPDKKEEIPSLLYLFLLDRYGIRISAVREQIAADMATEEDCRLLQLAMPSAVLTIDEVAYDQSALPVLVAKHRATTRSHRYVHEVQ